MAASRATKRKLTEDPSTLVYALSSSSTLPFEHFSLIVRSLHTYLVEDVTINPESKSIFVKLGYQASVKNAADKLGHLSNDISVNKASSYVKPEELSLLDELKRKYQFGGTKIDEVLLQRTKKSRTYIPSANFIEENSE